MPMSQTTETYDDQIVRLFLLAAVGWGAIGMSVIELRRALVDVQPYPA